MRVYKRGLVYWGDFQGANGRRVRRSLGTGRRAEAERRLTELACREKAKASIRIGELLERWRAHKLRHTEKERSHEVYELMAKRFTQLWGGLPADDFPLDLVERYKAEALGVGMSAVTVNQAVGHFLAALRWGQRLGLVGKLPRVERLKVTKRRVPKYLSEDELRALLRKCREPRYQRLEVVVRLSMNCGLRTGEIVWLNWADLDLANGWVHVTAKKGWSPKSNAERSVPISEDFAAWLKRQRERLGRSGPGDPVAPLDLRTGQRWDRRLLTRRVTQLFAAAKVEVQSSRHKLHLIRGTFATLVLRAGGDLESVRDMLGHTDLKTTAGYLTATSESKRRAVAGLKLPE